MVARLDLRTVKPVIGGVKGKDGRPLPAKSTEGSRRTDKPQRANGMSSLRDIGRSGYQSVVLSSNNQTAHNLTGNNTGGILSELNHSQYPIPASAGLNDQQRLQHVDGVELRSDGDLFNQQLVMDRSLIHNYNVMNTSQDE